MPFGAISVLWSASEYYLQSSSSMWQSAHQKMIDRGLPARSVRYTHSVLRSAIRQAIRWRLLLQDPTDGADLAQDSSPTEACLPLLSKHLRSHLSPVKSLKILVNASLKRLASGVQLPPWPPKSFTFNNLHIILNSIHRADILVSRSSSIFIILCVR